MTWFAPICVAQTVPSGWKRIVLKSLPVGDVGTKYVENFSAWGSYSTSLEFLLSATHTCPFGSTAIAEAPEGSVPGKGICLYVAATASYRPTPPSPPSHTHPLPSP